MAVVTEEWQRHAACKGPKAELFFPPTVPERRKRRRAGDEQPHRIEARPRGGVFEDPHVHRRDAEEHRRLAARERDAKAICASCAVAPECLEYALKIREAHGIWGGTTELERRAISERQAS